MDVKIILKIHSEQTVNIPSGFSKPTISSFKTIENKCDVCPGKDCMKIFCKSLRQHTMKMILKSKKWSYWQKSSKNHMKMQKSVIFVKKNLKMNILKNIYKVRDHCHYPGKYRGAMYSICNIKYSVPKKILIAFLIGCNYDYRFSIQEFAE